MNLVHLSVKRVGLRDSGGTYERRRCGATFESHSDPGSVRLKCSACESEDVEPTENEG